MWFSMRGFLVRTTVLLTVALFATLGASVLGPLFSPRASTIPFGGEASTDQFLGILAVPHPAAKLEETFRRWSNDKAFLFIAPANQPFWRQTYYTFAYLAYPRTVSAVVCSANPAERDEIHRESTPNIDGLIFFDVPPGALRAGAQQIGPILYIAPYHGSPIWKSFCP